jgi:hypothetical protein
MEEVIHGLLRQQVARGGGFIFTLEHLARPVPRLSWPGWNFLVLKSFAQYRGTAYFLLFSFLIYIVDSSNGLKVSNKK